MMLMRSYKKCLEITEFVINAAIKPVKSIKKQGKPAQNVGLEK